MEAELHACYEHKTEWKLQVFGFGLSKAIVYS